MWSWSENKMKVYLIRHGETQGNREKRYAGITDESLTKEGAEMLKNIKAPLAEKLYVSPLKRTRETAEILYPNMEYEICENLKECNFGEFENLNYEELKDKAEYQMFIDTGGRTAFPRGEDFHTFQKRCCDAFEKIVGNEKNDIAFVIHGGTIMALLDRYSLPHKDYYSWMAENGKGFEGEIEKGDKIYIKNIKEL